MDLKNLKAFVTGAGGGIGKEVAVTLAKEGATVYLIGGNNHKKLEETLGAVNAVGGECYIFNGNLTDDAVLDKIFLDAVTHSGGIDILVNNAGVAMSSEFKDTAIETFDKIMAINARVPFILMQKSLPYLLKSKRASIINIASVVSHAGYPLQSAYVASKHALLGLTKSVAAELFDKGVRVHAISPGGVYTDMVKVSRPDLTPDGMIMPKEIADIVLFLLKNRGNAVIDEIMVHRVNKQPFLI